LEMTSVGLDMGDSGGGRWAAAKAAAPEVCLLD
jgi:hypothetical protein